MIPMTDLTLRTDKVGTWTFDEYPTYDEWIAQFDFTKHRGYEEARSPYTFSHLPVWSRG